MSNEETTSTNGTWTGRLTPSDVHNALFGRAGIGRRGYDEGEVDFFLERVQNELVRLIGEKSALREDVDRLRNQVATNGPGSAPQRDEASAQAVGILSAAQQTADQYVAEAEQFSRRLTIETREHCDELIVEARARSHALLDEADRAAAEAAERYSSQTDGEDGETGLGKRLVVETAEAKRELEEQVAYLRTFSEVCRVQLRAYLEALLHDIEDEWGKASPEALGLLPSRARGGIPAPALPAIDLRDDRESDVRDDRESNQSEPEEASDRTAAAAG